jgi:hypothetical protein
MGYTARTIRYCGLQWPWYAPDPPIEQRIGGYGAR